MKTKKTAPLCQTFGRAAKAFFMGIALALSCTALADDECNLSYKDSSIISYTPLNGEVITGTARYPIFIFIGEGKTVRFRNMSIDGNNLDNPNDRTGPAIWCAGNATIILEGTNTVSGLSGGCPGIYVEDGCTLTIKGDGKLTATGNGNAAGIGGGNDQDCQNCGNIVIEGNPTIIAKAGLGYNAAAAGIGGGVEKTCGNITIHGGTITAQGGEGGGAGIGAGAYGSCGNIYIDGGTIRATGGYESGTLATASGIGAGFGNSYYPSSCGNITIKPGIASIRAIRRYEIKDGTTIHPDGIGGGFGENNSVGTISIAEGLLQGDVPADSATTMQQVVEQWDGNLDEQVLADGGNVTAFDGTTITGTLLRNCKITIADGATVTLDGAVITNGENSSSYPWAGLNCQSNATIILAPGSANFVKGFYQYYPGIHVPAGATLTISGTGSLDASGNRLGAGIGGGYDVSCGDIIINGGTIIATGGVGCPGIGGGCNSGKECGNITITGGDVTAKSGNQSAGIGSGSYGSCGNIAITGGTVTAIGGNQGASIGSGFHGQCGAITIGTDITRVVAKHLYDNQYNPVGAGDSASCGLVSIDPALSTEISDDGKTYTYSPGWDGNLATLTGNVTIESDMTIYGELAGQYKITIADGVTVTLNNAIITNGVDRSSYSWAGINCQSNATIILAAGSENFVKGFYNEYPGIHVPVGATLTIKGTGILTVNSGSNNHYAAGIGGGYQIDCGRIVIDGGTINAAGGTGIGSGRDASCDGIVISNGTVVATGGYAAPGIGAGNGGSCGNITITGGSVTATGYNYAAGIGSGDNSSRCGNISITGGRVTATGGNYGAGIGSGDTSSICGDIYIGEDILRVEATHGVNAAEPIGKGGSSASCGSVTVDAAYDDHGTTTRILAAVAPWDGNLSTLTGDVTVYADITIYGTLGGNYKVTIADGVKVTLNGAIIDGSSYPSSEWAGLTCDGDATLILTGSNSIRGFSASCPGIYVPAGSTLTVRGSGSLTASSNSPSGEGIGGGGTVVALGMTDTTDGPTRTFVPAPWNGDLSALFDDVTIESDMTLYGELAELVKISIADGVTVTLSNAVINGVDDSSYKWAGLTCDGDATIILASGSANFVKGFYQYYPGIHVPAGSTLTIKETGILTANSGSTYSYAAGIGGGYQLDCGSIVIDGGTINATGGTGIGSGRDASCDDIVISNGTIVATGGGIESPGIGAGSRGSCGNITITGGSVTATGGNYGAGIGTGDYTSQCGNISITGGNVTATGGSKGAGIGSADDSSRCEGIYIGANIVCVEATCGSGAVPIGKGGGSSASCGTVTVDSSLTDDDDSPTRTITGNGSSGVYTAWATANGVTGAWDATDANGIANVIRYVFDTPSGNTVDTITNIAINAAGKAVVYTAELKNTSGFTVVILASDEPGSHVNTAIFPISGDGVTTIDEPKREKRFFSLLFREEGDDSIPGQVVREKVQLWANGPYWATTNIGAENPEDSGYYFWWGDTVGYTYDSANSQWVSSADGTTVLAGGFSSDNCGTYGGTYDISSLTSEGWITAGGVLAPEHDAATQHWGGDWRMPTYDEIRALVENCTWTRTTLNGVNGYFVNGQNEYASNRIFLPASGFGDETSLMDRDFGSNDFFCWSSVPSSDDDGSWSIIGGSYLGSSDRSHGFPIRPVQGYSN